ncbi:hypothetical protein Q1M63_06630 (plasmid) [Sinorhizobium meliloti]|nr:hypothetical protein Q1M63_06630 [Sinorhizobium meliloti]
MTDIATPNRFELSWLTERKLATTWDLVATRQVLRFAPEAQLITSGRALEDTTLGEIETTILGATRVSSAGIRRSFSQSACLALVTSSPDR